MSTIGSIVTIVLVLAAIFVPQALTIYLNDGHTADRDEYIPDGR